MIHTPATNREYLNNTNENHQDPLQHYTTEDNKEYI